MVKNAGISTNYWKEFEGIESILATNVISTELLALLLLPKLRETATRFNTVPRLSIVASDLHFLVKFEERNEVDIFAALNDKEKTNFGERYVLHSSLEIEGITGHKHRYGVTKLLEVFFVRELAKKIDESRKPKVIVNCMTPGACNSDFDRESTGLKRLLMKVAAFLIARTTEAGSRTEVAGITAGEESHGQYMENCVVARYVEI